MLSQIVIAATQDQLGNQYRNGNETVNYIVTENVQVNLTATTLKEVTRERVNLSNLILPVQIAEAESMTKIFVYFEKIK